MPSSEKSGGLVPGLGVKVMPLPWPSVSWLSGVDAWLSMYPVPPPGSMGAFPSVSTQKPQNTYVQTLVTRK